MTKDNMELLIGTADIDALLEESKIFITSEVIDSEIEFRLRKEIGLVSGLFIVFHPDGEAPGGHNPALTVLGMENAVSISRSQGVTRLLARSVSGQPNSLKPGAYLACSEQSLHHLRNEVRQFLACEHVDQVYNLDLDLQAKLELRCRMEEVSRSVGRALADAWSVIVHVTDSGIEYRLADQVKSGTRFSARIADTILPQLMNEDACNHL
jgi:hypothetical protein